jgi:hypothetical protein
MRLFKLKHKLEKKSLISDTDSLIQGSFNENGIEVSRKSMLAKMGKQSITTTTPQTDIKQLQTDLTNN